MKDIIKVIIFSALFMALVYFGIGPIFINGYHSFGYFLLSFVGTIPTYFLAYKYLYWIIRREDSIENSNFPTHLEQGNMWTLAFMLSFFLTTSITYISSSLAKKETMLATIDSKNIQYSMKYNRNTYYIIILDNKENIWVSLGKGKLVSKGERLNIQYRDTLLGVRYYDEIKTVDSQIILND